MCFQCHIITYPLELEQNEVQFCLRILKKKSIVPALRQVFTQARKHTCWGENSPLQQIVLSLFFCKLDCTWCVPFKITCTIFVYYGDLKYTENTFTQDCRWCTFLFHNGFYVLLEFIRVLLVIEMLTDF